MRLRGRVRPLIHQRYAGVGLLIASLTVQFARSDGKSESPPAAVEPAWSITSSHAIEWMRVVPEKLPTSVCYATVAGVFAIGLESGNPSGSGPLVRAPDVRPAQCQGAELESRPLIVFDREGIHGLRPDRSEPLAWSYREAADSPAARQGDPEQLSRWIDAAASEDRVVALNVDGRMVILDRDSGVVRWRDDLGPLSVARLHVDASRAVVLARQQGRVWAAILDSRGDHPRMDRVELAAEWPIWSSLAGETLVVVGDSRMRCIRASGPAATIPLDAPQPPAMSICRIGPRGVALLRPSAIVALDVVTGEALWCTPLDDLRTDDPPQLSRDGNLLLARSRNAAWLLECETGRLRARAARKSGAVASADGGLITIRPQDDARVWFVERHTTDVAGASLQLQWPGEHAPGAAESPRQVTWLPDAVVISTSRMIVFYGLRGRLPRP